MDDRTTTDERQSCSRREQGCRVVRGRQTVASVDRGRLGSAVASLALAASAASGHNGHSAFVLELDLELGLNLETTGLDDRDPDEDTRRFIR
jgi:hypothetical protein